MLRTPELLELRSPPSDGDPLHARLGDRDDPARMIASEVRQVRTTVVLTDEYTDDFVPAREADLGWKRVLGDNERSNHDVDEHSAPGTDHRGVRDAALGEAARQRPRRNRRRNDQQSQRDEKLARQLRYGNGRRNATGTQSNLESQTSRDVDQCREPHSGTSEFADGLDPPPISSLRRHGRVVSRRRRRKPAPPGTAHDSALGTSARCRYRQSTAVPAVTRGLDSVPEPRLEDLRWRTVRAKIVLSCICTAIAGVLVGNARVLAYALALTAAPCRHGCRAGPRAERIAASCVEASGLPSHSCGG